MIQFNLLPDIKQKYVKTQRLKRLIILGAMGLSAAALAAFIFLLIFVDLIQKKSISDLDRDIKSKTGQVQSTKDLDKLLTVQNQLNSLPALDSARPVVLNLFQYMGQLTPPNAVINKLSSDWTMNSITLNGGANNLQTVNTFVDTIKLTTYGLDGKTDSTPPAFSSVVLSSFSIDDKGNATFTITFNFDPTIFSDAHVVNLIPPTAVDITNINKPAALFKKSAITFKAVR